MAKEPGMTPRRLWNEYIYYVVIFGVVIWAFFTMLDFWRDTPQMNRDRLMATYRVIDEQTVLEDIARHGDAYGSINALFSGVAMVAAIGAILLQTFEFRHQRMELSLTNDTHKERLEFDRDVHADDRRGQIRDLVLAYQDPLISSAFEKLAKWSTEGDFPYSQIGRYAADEEGLRNLMRTHATPHSNPNVARLGMIDYPEEILRLRSQVKEAGHLLPLMKFLSRLSMMQLDKSELEIWSGMLDRYRFAIEGFARGADTSLAAVPPIWPKMVLRLYEHCDKVRQSRENADPA